MTVLETPVLIVGGGGCGLSASIFLSNLGVEHLLVERRDTTSHLPKAHYLNQRTMEVFRQHGIADAVFEVGAPIEKFGKVRWLTSLGGDGPLDRKIIHAMDAFGGGSLSETYNADSPVTACNYPQLRLEPLLRREAERRAPDSIRFGQEVQSWEQDADGVRVTVRDLATDESYTIAARYLIAADGGRTFGPALETVMAGPTEMLDMVSTHFSADLSEYCDDESLITWFLNPEGKDSWGAGAMVQMGPTWGRHSEEWVFHFAFQPQDPERFDEEKIVPRLRTLLRLPDLELEVHKISHWILDRVVAQQWRYGRIFLAGDAAHRQPPTTGLGLNTGIQDAHNLAWKLARVLNDQAPDAFLDSYESERLPVSTHGADWALLAFMNHFVIDAGIGLIPGAPPEVNTGAFHALFSPGLIGDALRHRAEVCINTQSWEFQAHDVEIGFSYAEGAVAPDGTELPARDPSGREYRPTTRPGHRLPHAWLERDGRRSSTHDLVGTGGFALITGTDGEAWTKAAQEATARFGVDIAVVSVGPGGDYADAEGSWATLRQISEGGALLVRPDNVVAFRAMEADPDAVGALGDAVAVVLGR
jgi:2,4-dichlorophenol 6-monooxygenase